MSSSAIRAGAAYIELTLRDGVSRPLRNASFALKDFGNAVSWQGAKIAAMGAAVTAPLAAMAHSFARSALESGRFANRRDAGNVMGYVAALQRLSTAMTEFRDAVGAAVLPLKTTWPNMLAKILERSTAWVRANRELVQTIARLATIVVAAGTAIVFVGSGIRMMGSVLGVLAGVATVAATAVAAIGAVLAAIVTPMGLVIAGVVALGAYLLYATGTGAQAVAWLGKAFVGLHADAAQAWEGIAAAIAKGDIEQAVKVLWSFINLEWQKGVNALNQLWIDAESFFLDIWDNASFDAAGYFIDAWAMVEVAWQETVDFLADAWDICANTFKKTWNTFTGFLEKGWVSLKGGWSTTTEFLSDVWADFTSGMRKAWNSCTAFIEKAWVRLKGWFKEDINVNAEVNRIDQEADAKNQQIAADDRKRKKNRNPELQRIDAQTAAQNQAIDDQQNAVIGSRNQNRTNRRAEIKQNYEDQKRALREGREAEQKRRREDFQQRRDAAQGKEDQARQEFNGAVDLAKTDSPSKDPPPSIVMPLVREQSKLESKGTFNALAARGLGSSSLADRTAKATEKSAELLKSIDKSAKEGLVFV